MFETNPATPAPPKNLSKKNQKARVMFLFWREFAKMLAQFGVLEILGGCGGLRSREHF